MKETEKIISKFLGELGREKVHFDTSSKIDVTEAKKNFQYLLERRLKGTDNILTIYIIMLVILFGVFIYFLINLVNPTEILVLITGSGISAGVFGWIIKNLKSIWNEKTIVELILYAILSKELTTDELIKMIEVIKDKVA